MMTTFSRGSKLMSPSGTNSGKSCKYPTSRAADIALFNARPTIATERSFACAAFTIESIRAILLAKHVTATRPLAAPIASVKPSRASASEPVCPATIALVESPTMTSTPSSPSLASRSLSVSVPRTGVLSNFQSPVCKTVPASVRMAKAAGSGIEWLRPIISISKAPIFSTAFMPISCNGIS